MQQLQLIQTFSTRNGHRESKAHPGKKSRKLSTLQIYQFWGCSSTLREVTTVSSVASPEPHLVKIESDLNELKMPYSYGTQQPINSPSLNCLILSMNFFNVKTPTSPAPRRETQLYPTQADDSRIHPEIFDFPDFSTPPVGDSPVDAWQTSSVVGTFETDQPHKLKIAWSPSSTPPPPRRWKMESVAAHLQSMRWAPALREIYPNLKMKVERSCLIS